MDKTNNEFDEPERFYGGADTQLNTAIRWVNKHPDLHLNTALLNQKYFGSMDFLKSTGCHFVFVAVNREIFVTQKCKVGRLR